MRDIGWRRKSARRRLPSRPVDRARTPAKDRRRRLLPNPDRGSQSSITSSVPESSSNWAACLKNAAGDGAMVHHHRCDNQGVIGAFVGGEVRQFQGDVAECFSGDAFPGAFEHGRYVVDCMQVIASVGEPNQQIAIAGADLEYPSGAGEVVQQFDGGVSIGRGFADQGLLILEALGVIGEKCLGGVASFAVHPGNARFQAHVGG